jgi:hypothetical protein
VGRYRTNLSSSGVRSFAKEFVPVKLSNVIEILDFRASDICNCESSCEAFPGMVKEEGKGAGGVCAMIYGTVVCSVR